jgi:hypothetical protein
VILKDFGYTLTTLLVSGLDVASNSVWRWNLEVGMSSCEEIDELGIGDDGCRTIAFSYPFRNVGSDIYVS